MVGDTTFESLINDGYLTFTSSKNLTLQYEYADRTEDATQEYDGFPTEPGYYLVRSYTEDTDNINGSYAVVCEDIE